jgi:hypothetical protein
LLFVLAAVILVARWRASGWRRARFCLIGLAVMLIASCFTISVLGPHHLVILLVFPSVVIAAAFAVSWSNRRGPLFRAALLALAVLAALQFAWDCSNSLAYRRSLAMTRGVGAFSSAHNDVANWLAGQGIDDPLAADWGLRYNVEVVAAGAVVPRSIIELYEPHPFAFTREQARETLRDPGSVYLFHAEDVALARGRHRAIAEVAAELGLELVTVETFADGLGRPVVLVARPQPMGE